MVDAKEIPVAQAAELILAFIEAHSVATLNVAGPRQSKAPGACAYTCDAMSLVVQEVLRGYE